MSKSLTAVGHRFLIPQIRLIISVLLLFLLMQQKFLQFNKYFSDALLCPRPSAGY